ncbi:hemolysin XhlA [Escherichia sp. ESNIH1]|uniref:hemolysin XhlA n=1 Tax=Escherichia sp. ESNIH1 TaxID=1985876 RepID=UPI000CDE1A32|nr:hemolysin XhlA [Escherichia sp. ESNIH1]POU03993.1 hemolysin XhlA [Escherichia sp. ESNIH1]
MEIRVKTLEEKVESLVMDVAVIKSNYATKEDTSAIRIEVANVKAELHSVIRTQAMAIIGSMIAITGVASGVIIKFLAH